MPSGQSRKTSECAIPIICQLTVRVLSSVNLSVPNSFFDIFCVLLNKYLKVLYKSLEQKVNVMHWAKVKPLRISDATKSHPNLRSFENFWNEFPHSNCVHYYPKSRKQILCYISSNLLNLVKVFKLIASILVVILTFWESMKEKKLKNIFLLILHNDKRRYSLKTNPNVNQDWSQNLVSITPLSHA